MEAGNSRPHIRCWVLCVSLRSASYSNGGVRFVVGGVLSHHSLPLPPSPMHPPTSPTPAQSVQHFQRATATAALTTAEVGAVRAGMVAELEGVWAKFRRWQDELEQPLAVTSLDKCVWGQ